MANLIEYIQWRGDIDFTISPFNEVDALILEQICYSKFDGLVSSEFSNKTVTLEQVAEKFFSAEEIEDRIDEGLLINPLTPELFKYAAQSKRFGQLRVCGFVNIIDTEEDEQFAAITYIFKDGSFFIAYRGTDDTIVGWKEDFDLGWKEIVPSQKDALSYLEKAASSLKSKFHFKQNQDIMLGGHSKGGNLSVYAAVNSNENIKKRILSIYNHDGPGFNKVFFETENFKSIRQRIHTYVPQLSIIGMLFSHDEGFITIESEQKGLYQHDPFSWKTLGKKFIELPDTKDESKVISATVNQWFNELDIEEKEVFVETIFGLLKDTKAKTNTEFTANIWDNLGLVLKSITKLDAKTRNTVFKTLQLLFKSANDNVLSEVKRISQQKK